MKAFCVLVFAIVITACSAQEKSSQYKYTDQLEKLASDLEQNYIFGNKAIEMKESILTNLNMGRYDQLNTVEELAETLNTELKVIAEDKHLRIRTESTIYNRSGSEGRRKSYTMGIGESQILDGNIGYLEITGFYTPNNTLIKLVQENLERIEDTEAIIIDLRNNGGGSPDCIRLICSYFFDNKDSILLNSLYFRNSDIKNDFYTITDLQGPYLPDKPLYLLTSHYTFSGGEEFCYNMKTRKRATLVGETTGGGAHPVDRFVYSGGLIANIPVGRAINPITNTNWEGVGVQPDYPTSEENALSKALKLIE